MSTTDNSTPLATAKSFLAGIKARKVADMRSLCHAKATACLIRNEIPNHLILSEVLDRIDEIGDDIELDEVSHDEVEHVDGDFATVWTPYKFFEDGKIHHDGTNNFTLWKSPEQGWLITAVQDVARTAPGVTGMHIISGQDAKPA